MACGISIGIDHQSSLSTLLLVAHWTNHRDYTRGSKGFMILLITETASSKSIERVFSRLT